jgi:GT2 family glycosyltransferase
VGGGRNALTGFGRGRVIAAIDNDAEFADATTLARMVAALDAEPDLAAIGCRILRSADGGDDLTSWGYPRALLPQAGARFDTVTFVGAGHAIRRAAWDTVGPYDASLFFCWEEYDFCLRAIAQGWRIAYRGELEIRHKVAAEAREVWSGRRWYHFVRNRLRIARKLGIPWPVLAPRVGAYLVKGARHGMSGLTLRAIIAAARMEADSHGPIALPHAARVYLRRHDTAHRGDLLTRWRQEVLGRLEPNRSLSSNGTIAGQSRR